MCFVTYVVLHLTADKSSVSSAVLLMQFNVSSIDLILERLFICKCVLFCSGFCVHLSDDKSLIFHRYIA